MKTVVSEKGQITIPKMLRNRLGLAAGTVLRLADRLLARDRGYLRDYFKGLNMVQP